MQKPIFNRTPLATAVAVALGATVFSPVVVAQDDAVIEENETRLMISQNIIYQHFSDLNFKFT